MREYYQFFYVNNNGVTCVLGTGFYKQPKRTYYYKSLEHWFNRDWVKSFGYKVLNED